MHTPTWHKLVFVVIAFAVGTGGGASGVLRAVAPDELAPAGLARLFEPGQALQDRNGDERVDFVAARIALPDAPAPEEVAAASAVAARLGFETSGLSFPLVVPASASEPGDDAPLIVVGGNNALVPEPFRLRLASLKPGQGLVGSSGSTIVIAGNQPEGTRAAAEAFASRSPYLWEVIGRENGETYERVTFELARFLGEGGVEVSSVSVDELVFEKDRNEVVSVTLTAALASGGAVRARELLTNLEVRHREGQQTDRLSYSGAASVTYRLEDTTSVEVVTLERVGIPQRLLTPPRDRSFRPFGEQPRVETVTEFDLSDLYSVGGLLKDADKDQIADDTDTRLIFPAKTNEGDYLPARGATHLAARLGLESAGISFPIVQLDSEVKDAKKERNLIVFGEGNRLARDLRRLGKRRALDAAAGTGFVEVVPTAFGKTPAVVVSGGDLEGAEAAAEYLAGRAPNLWETGSGKSTIEDVEDAIHHLVNGRTAAGQAALALARVEELIAELEDKELDSLELEVYLEEASPEFDRFLSELVAEGINADHVEVKSQSRSEAVVVFEEKPSFVWEVDEFWKRFREVVLPRLGSGSRVSVELRVSESPELRTELEGKIRAEIEQAEGQPADVRVLSAYKQGLSWLLDEVAPELVRMKDRGLASIEVSWKPFPVDTSKKWRFYNEPARWLNELYPADELLSRELHIPLSAISFRMQKSDDATYQLTAKNASGEVIFEDSFSPASYDRPFLDAFPDKARVTVTTGWIRVDAGDETLLDERLPTDLDRIWDYYQGTALAQVYDHVKKVTGGKPTREKQPFFHTLRFELKASEPDYRLGLDQEHVSSLESIHDDVYFDTLAFFYEVVEDAGGEEAGARRGAPGNVLPWIHPERRGQAPELSLTYSGYASNEPKLVWTYREKGGEEKTDTHKLEPVKLARPSAFLAELRAGEERLARLGVSVTLEEVEPLERLVDLLDNLTRLQDAGVFQDAFEFEGVGEIAIRVDAPGATSTRAYASLAPSKSDPLPTHTGEQLVTWDHVISPEESERIAHTLGTLPEISTYVAGRSFQGRAVSVMEIALPMEAELVSQAKMSTWKPVLSILARQHANEVSSTSHALRLAELLATDLEYRRYLDKMNVVIQPVVNPDGAALAHELQKLTPSHCLHAGRYSALGPDVPREAGNPDTLVTEALVLNKVFNRWLPDFQLNPHGYPSHEWVQTFANYNPYSFRSYWIPRGWYTSVRPVEDPRYPHHRATAFAMRDHIAAEVSRDPEVRSTNLRIYDRYRRWTTRWQPHVYNLEVHNDTAIYFSRRSGTAPRPRARADITVFSAGTEAMDETAQGEWLDLVTRMGFGFLKASLKFLDEADYTLYRLEEERRDKVSLSVTRPRPLKPGGTSAAATSNDP